MPLPSALQARLQRRGLIKHQEGTDDVVKEAPAGKPSCQNAWNPYHTCVKYCKERWGGEEEGKSKENRKPSVRPLPPGWFLVPDQKSGHIYYWNVHTNMVSWLHPQDSRATITLPASFQLNQETSQQNLEQPAVPGEEGNTEKETSESKREENKKLPPKIKTGKHPSLLKGQKDKDKANPYKRKQNKKEELDPMDPAAYSDVARGTWNSGLREDIDVKTGVDTTANGPLFQQRPYPSPGEVLRRNRQQQQRQDDN